MGWLHGLFGFQGASYVRRVELSTAAAPILGAFQPIFSALGAAMSAATDGRWIPMISAEPGQVLLKDLVLQAASLSLLLASVSGPKLSRGHGALPGAPYKACSKRALSHGHISAAQDAYENNSGVISIAVFQPV
jgi:hypothetical protein